MQVLNKQKLYSQTLRRVRAKSRRSRPEAGIPFSYLQTIPKPEQTRLSSSMLMKRQGQRVAVTSRPQLSQERQARLSLVVMRVLGGNGTTSGRKSRALSIGNVTQCTVTARPSLELDLPNQEVGQFKKPFATPARDLFKPEDQDLSNVKFVTHHSGYEEDFSPVRIQKLQFQQSSGWQMVEQRIKLLLLLVSFIQENRKLLNQLYPEWVLSSSIIYRRFYSQRLSLQRSLQSPTQFFELFGRRLSSEQFQTMVESHSQEIQGIKIQNKQIQGSLLNIEKKAKKVGGQKHKEADGVDFDQLFEKLKEETNRLSGEGDQRIQQYLCHKLDCLLILRELDGGERFKAEEKVRVRSSPREYLVGRITQLNSL